MFSNRRLVQSGFTALCSPREIFVTTFVLRQKRRALLDSLNSRTITKILAPEQRRELALLSALRVIANGMDLVGVAGIGVLAAAFGSFASGASSKASVEIPLIGQFLVGELEAVLIAMAVVLTFLVKSGLSILLNLRSATCVGRIESSLSQRLVEDFFSISEFSSTRAMPVSDFQNLVMTSTSGIRVFLNARILLYSEGSLLIGLLLVFAAVNPVAMAFLVAYMGLVVLILNNAINVRLRRLGNEQISGSRDALSTIRDLHGIRREAATAGALEDWMRKFADARARISLTTAWMYALNSLPRFVIETSMIVGIFFFIGSVVIFSDIPSESVTIGVFMAGGLRVVASVIPFQGAISGMKTGAATGRFAFNSLVTVQEKAGYPSPNPNPNCTVNPVNSITFDNVSFTYPNSSRPTIESATFRIDPFKKTALVGPSGAGKSTLLDLSMGFLLPDTGEVKIGDQNARDVLLNQPNTLAIVPQHPHLVTGSITENISLLPDNQTDLEKARVSLTMAGLGKLTASRNWARLSIAPDSGQFSGGELQRLSLARALYSNPSILFLDEATSALDAETERDLSRVVDALSRELTLVIIAHRLSTVRNADKLIYVDDGRIVAEGTFDELEQNVEGFARAIRIMGLH